MRVIHDDVEQGSEEWLTLREGKFTGSMAYKLLGSMGATEYARTRNDNFRGNFFTKRGSILEGEAIELYESINSCVVERPGYITNSEYPECLYSPDGIDNDILLEVKCFGEKPHMDIFNGNIPLKILAQIHFGMLIGEFKRARLIIYNPDLEAHKAFRFIEIPAKRAITANFKRILSV